MFNLLRYREIAGTPVGGSHVLSECICWFLIAAVWFKFCGSVAAYRCPIALGEKPEFLASDGAGKVYINLEDKNQVAVLDLKARKVLAHWPVVRGGLPAGLSIDTEKRRLFMGCRSPQKLIVMSTDDGNRGPGGPSHDEPDKRKQSGNANFLARRHALPLNNWSNW
jgi:hypothetical protein